MRRRDLLLLLATCVRDQPLSARNESITNLEQWLRSDPVARKRALASNLRRIRQLDKSIHAWVQVDPQPQTGDGALSGIPFGVKDVIETQNLVTEFGSPIYKGRLGTTDAAVVRQLKGLGAILLGKTQTAAFAYTMPPPTRNPRNSRTHPAEVRVVRPPRSPLTWSPSRWARKLEVRSCGQPLSAGSQDSSRPTD
jgi:Asp-tRNA(Asn)/Glu-tRNA(Gln) amidotransferase A subunit family amidase